MPTPAHCSALAAAQAYAKFQKDMAAQPPASPEVHIQDRHLHVRIPPLPPLVNTPQQGPQAEPQGATAQQPHPQDQQPEGLRAGGAAVAGQGGGDASVAVSSSGPGLKSTGSGRAAGWGTSNISRPSNLAGVYGMAWGPGCLLNVAAAQKPTCCDQPAQATAEQAAVQ